MADRGHVADGPHPRYEKVKHLGRGGFGRVTLCKDKTTGELVAIKLLPRASTHTDYIQAEILNHRRLWHPHVVQFREVFLTPCCLAIVMEYVPGGNLARLLRCYGRLSEDQARWFFQQLVLTLDYCHRCGVTNRDIKLENTLLDDSPLPLIKLCDFGYSKHAELQSAPASVVGTPAYVAPEVLQSRQKGGYKGPPVDVWSSGVLLFTMLTGSFPFEPPDDTSDPHAMRQLYRRILSADYKIPKAVHLSWECQNLLSRILVADPLKRITIPEILQHPWFTKLLPRGALQMSEPLEPPPEGLQSEDEIRAIVAAACLEDSDWE